uniref:Radical SAM core domain-containing protein n=1 Tax=Accipiter nisus TaxID=211598 RepID=A0A8B9N9W8_9AVES
MWKPGGSALPTGPAPPLPPGLGGAAQVLGARPGAVPRPVGSHGGAGVAAGGGDRCGAARRGRPGTGTGIGTGRPRYSRALRALALLPQALLLLQLQQVRGAGGGRGGRARLPGAGGTRPAPPQPGAEVGAWGGLGLGGARPFSTRLQPPHPLPYSVTSVFFGGGTPSLASPRTIAAVLEAVAGAAHLPAGAEVTLEANPSSAGIPRLAGFREAGVNRLSIGVQVRGALPRPVRHSPPVPPHYHCAPSTVFGRRRAAAAGSGAHCGGGAGGRGGGAGALPWPNLHRPPLRAAGAEPGRLDAGAGGSTGALRRPRLPVPADAGAGHGAGGTGLGGGPACAPPGPPG